MAQGAKVRRPRALWEDPDTTWQIAVALPVSIGLHAAIVVVMILQSLFAWKNPLPPPRYEVMLVGPLKKGTPGSGKRTTKPPNAPTRDAVKADVLPAPKTNELVIPVETPRNTKPGATPIPDPKTARAEALARAKREAALERAKELQARNNATSAIPETTPGVIPDAAASNGGGDGTGDGGSEYGVEWSTLTGSATYEQQIQAILNDLWIPSLGSEKKQIQCIVRVIIGFDGTITSTKLEQRSDDAAFDASVLATFRKLPGGKFPPPPIDLKSYLSKRGVPLRFDSRTKKSVGSAP